MLWTLPEEARARKPKLAPLDEKFQELRSRRNKSGPGCDLGESLSRWVNDLDMSAGAPAPGPQAFDARARRRGGLLAALTRSSP
jgi:hypothetical protein